MVVLGLTGEISALSVKIDGLTHPDFLFLHFLLIAPDGQSNLLLLDRSGNGVSITDESYLFTDSPDLFFPVGFTPLKPISGPSLHGQDFGLPSLQVNNTFHGSTLASAFGGINPNGIWKLIVLDDDGNNPGGSFTDWKLTIVDNVAPVISVPADHINVDAGSSITLSGANGNLPTSNDPDYNTNDLLFVTFTTEHGTIENSSLAFPFGPTKNYASGTNAADVVSHFMSGAVYKPDPGFTGIDHLTITVEDVGVFDSGAELGALTTTKTLTIEVFDHKTGTSGDDSFTASGYQKIDGGAGKDTIKFDFALTQAIVTYSDNTVTIEGPGTKTVLTGFERFVFNDGTVDNADGSPLVDDLFYYTRNHDVWAAHVDPDKHYAEFGWHEGRNPNAFFDTNGYLSTYIDVKVAGVNPLQHYHEFGWKEGRDPSTAFDTGDYFASYADVNAAHVDPLAHFLQFGEQEGRHAFNDGVWG
jgi:subtilisin-like proprotein convertase family protein